MKQQFLDLIGLTELTGYIKKCINEHKVIVPYASSQSFPSVGDINTIYIDTTTNSIYRWDTPTKTYIILAKAIRSVEISESTENGKIVLSVDGTKTSIPVHGLGSAAFTEIGDYSPTGHTHTKSQVGLGNVDNTADKDKTVKAATSASSVPWTGITGKPSTYAPSSHTHDDRYYTETEMNSKLAGYLPISGGSMNGTAMISWPDSGNWSKNNADVTFPVNRGGLSWSGQSDGIQLYAVETGNDNLELYLKFTDDNSNGLSIRNKSNVQTARIASDGTITAKSFIGDLTGTASAAPWSGITGKPETYPPSSHTHNYAGSSSSGGIAWNASALYLNPQTRQTSANYDLTNSNTYAYRVNYSLATSAMTTGKPPADGHILTFGWDTDAGWGAQLCIGDAKDNHLYLRGSSSLKDSNNKNSSSWENWKTVLDSTNYNVYTPTKTGGGASGTWGISVSGNSATTTKLITARSINGTNFDGTGNITTATWGTARNITIGNTKKSVNGSADISWSLSEIGAAAASHSHSYLPLSGGTMSGNISYKGSKSTFEMIKFIDNTGDANGNGIAIGGGGLTIVGGGESSDTVKTIASGGGEERLILSNDGPIDIYTNCQDGLSKAVHVTIDNTGLYSGTAAKANSVPWTGVTGRPSSMPASDVYSWAKAASKPSYTKSEVGLGNVDNTADSAKSVKYATSAGTANAVAWGNVTGKPSTFTPSSHTHNYAGSSSAGGVANSAAKLATARTVSGGTDITMSFNYDGSGNSSANIGFYGSAASVGDSNNYPFHRFAKLDTIAASYSDKSTTFFISQDYNGGGFGIVRIVLRTNNSSAVSSVEVKWLVRCGLSADSVQVGLYNVFGKTYADAFFKTGGSYAGTYFRAIASGARGNASRTWVMVNSSEVSGTTASDAKTSTECYVTIAAAGTKLHKQAYTNTVSGVDSGSTSYANSAGNSTKWNGYTLDIATANTKDTWLLVANNNVIQHKLTTDFADSKHTHSKLTLPRITKDANSTAESNIFKAEEFSAGTAYNLPTNHWYHIITGQGSDNKYATQLALGMTTTNIAYRNRNNSDSTWGNWNTLLTSSNYTSYAATKGHTHDLSTMINTLTTGDAAPKDNDYYISQYVGGGTTTTTYHRRPHSALWTYIKGKTDSTYAPKSHTHNYAGSSSAGGNANAAVKLATARSINGTNFDGSGNITTANWGTARTITVGNTGKSVNGSGNVSWSLGEIGIHVSKTVPTASDGKNGDIWIVYE